MDKSDYIKHITQGVNRLAYRELLVETTLENPEYIKLLIDLIDETHLKEANHAARLLELVVKKKKQLILPYLDRFSGMAARLDQDASIRASAKIIEICCLIVANVTSDFLRFCKYEFERDTRSLSCVVRCFKK